MTTPLCMFFGGCFLGLSYELLFSSLCVAAKNIQQLPPEQEPEKDNEERWPTPFISWRITGEGSIPDTIAVETSPEGEIYLRTGKRQ